MIKKIRGTQDFIDLQLFNFIINIFRDHVHNYHFKQIKTPILEPVELFVRTLGEETDVVTKELFLVHGGKKESDELICLRPEGTAPIMRAFLDHNITLLPWKVFSYGPMFRYERPQKGRYRQFHQISCEVIGSNAIAEDAQLLKMLDRLFQEGFKLDNFALLINFLGCKNDRAEYKKILYSFLNEHTNMICQTCVIRKEKNTLRIFDCKNSTCKSLYQEAPHIADHLCDECQNEWQDLQKQLDVLSVPFSYEPTLVRGLDYYNKTVFEFVSQNLGAQNAFCGGGRYDHLAEHLGAKQEVPALGASIGIERLMMLLEPTKGSLPLPQPKKLHIIIPMNREQEVLALLIADELQAQKLCTEILFEGSLKSRLRKTNKFGAEFCLLIGPDEQDKHEVTVKNMLTSDEKRIKQADLVSYLKK